MSVPTLTAQAEAVHGRYRGAFVGRTRATRDLKLLDAIIRDMEQVGAKVSPDGADAEALRRAIEDWLALYRRERARIAEIQALGSTARDAWLLVEWTDVNALRYEREFVGRMKSGCDEWLLEEMVTRQERWLASLERLVARLDDDPLRGASRQARRRLGEYRAEVDAIVAARSSQEPAVLSRTLATLANAQFELFRRHLRGRPREGRRPALLERLIRAAESIARRMEAQRDIGNNPVGNARNLEVVGRHLATLRGELPLVRAARAALAPTALARVLGADANAVFTEYREAVAGRPRRAVDLVRLGEICDRVQEVAACMEETQQEFPSGVNARNLLVTREHVKLYEREARAIEQELGRA